MIDGGCYRGFPALNQSHSNAGLSQKVANKRNEKKNYQKVQCRKNSRWNLKKTSKRMNRPNVWGSRSEGVGGAYEATRKSNPTSTLRLLIRLNDAGTTGGQQAAGRRIECLEKL